MQNNVLTARIESTLTLVLGVLSVGVIAIGTWGLAHSFVPAASTVAVAAPLERVTITGSGTTAKAVQVEDQNRPHARF